MELGALGDPAVQASPIRAAYSTARPLATGSDPGSPRQTGQTWVLGSAPKTVGQAQNILVMVPSSQWVSMPMTVSYRRAPTSGATAAVTGAPPGAGWRGRILLEGPCGPEHGRLAQCRGDQLGPAGSPSDSPAGTDTAALPAG